MEEGEGEQEIERYVYIFAGVRKGERVKAQASERASERARGETGGNRANQSRLGYEGVAQAGHAEVSMATTGDKSTRNIPEYRQIKPHTHMCIRTHTRVRARIPTGNSAPKKFSLRPIYAAAACNGERALCRQEIFVPYPSCLVLSFCHFLSLPLASLSLSFPLLRPFSLLFVVLGPLLRSVKYSSFSCVSPLPPSLFVLPPSLFLFHLAIRLAFHSLSFSLSPPRPSVVGSRQPSDRPSLFLSLRSPHFPRLSLFVSLAFRS